jgi:predicted lipoprotein with Yx(FWY)xxD motif
MNTIRTHTRRRRWIVLASVLAGVAILAAGCGRAVPGSSGTPTLKLMKTAQARFLTDGDGHTLYLFEKDSNGQSSCVGACASVWPPYEVDEKPTAASELHTAQLGTTQRADGDRQVTYDGHPLYYYAGDASKSGSTDGSAIEQFGAEWYLVSASGGLLVPATEKGAHQSTGGY